MAFTRCTATVYVSGVLAAFSEVCNIVMYRNIIILSFLTALFTSFQEEDRTMLEQFLRDLMVGLSLSALPLDSLSAAVQQLRFLDCF